jgi:hypothetical protein
VLDEEPSPFHPLVANHAFDATAQFPRAYEGVADMLEGGRWRGITPVRLAPTLEKSLHGGVPPRVLPILGHPRKCGLYTRRSLLASDLSDMLTGFLH